MHTNDPPVLYHALKQAMLLFFLCFLPIQSIAETWDQQLFVQQRLEQLHFGTGDKIGSEPIYAADLVWDLYQANQFRLLWTEQDTVDQLLAAIRGCVQEGLIPDDYHLQALGAVGKILELAPSFARQVEQDLLLSDALLLLGNHKSYGKVAPGKVKERLNLTIPASQAFLPDLYLDAIKSGTLGKMLENLSPDHQMYADLKLALEHYRKIASSGGWPSVPPGPILKAGMRDDRVLALRTRLIITGELSQLGPDPTFFDTELSIAITSFQTQHYLEADGVPGPTTMAAMNRSVAARISQIRVDLERTRWVLHDLPSTCLIVDIAGFLVKYYQNSKEAWSSKVIVGQPVHQTPIFRSAVTYLVLNPTWTIPADITKNETLAEIIKNRQYLTTQHLRVLSRDGDEIDPATIVWNQYQGKSFPYTLRQDPGEDNALGLIKFIFPNLHQVYLHDTPAKLLFDRTNRAFSHGCIRTQNPLELGKLLIRNDIGNPINSARFDQILASGKTTTVPLKQPLPIFLIYWTTSINNREVWFKPDLYNRDQEVRVALDGPPSRLVQTLQIPVSKGQILSPAEQTTPPLNRILIRKGVVHDS